MKYWYLVCAMLLSALIPQQANATAYRAWFTGASITDGSGSVLLSTPSGAPALVSGGTLGNCLDLTTSVAMTDSNITTMLTNMHTRGIISFWIRPKWDGKVASGGSTHKLLRIGTPTATGNGLQVEVNNATGMLRFIMVGLNGAAVKMTVIRADVSTWKSGDWHHVAVGWIDRKNVPVGISVWVDRVALGSCIFGGTQFLAKPSDNTVYVGDTTAQAYMDELVMRDTTADYYPYAMEGPLRSVYRDYFRTAPYTAIQVTNTPHKVASDTRVIAGYTKQFGVTATKTVNVTQGTTTTEYITNCDGADEWSSFDAKDYITWTSANTSKATVDVTGLVTGVATTASPFNLTASFRGMTANYSLNVIASNLSDLDLMYVERTPRYRHTATQTWPNVGDTVTSIAHIGNFGAATVATGTTVKYELMPDANGNYIADDTVTTTVTHTLNYTIPAGAGTTYASPITDSYQWTWPSTPTFVRVTVTPPAGVTELCNANNQRCDLNTGRAIHWGFGYDALWQGNNDNNFVDDYNNRVINLVGSFSDYDFCQANAAKMVLMMRETKYATTDLTKGIMDSVRVDKFQTLDEYMADHNDPLGSWYDGGYEEIMGAPRLTFSLGNIHEMGHNVWGLIDLYCHTTWCANLLLKDSSSNYYGNTALYPNIGVFDEDNFDVGAWSNATWGYPDQIGMGWPPLQSNGSCHLWLEPMSAGWIHKFARDRSALKYIDYFANNAGTYVPAQTKLQLYDVNDNPLAYAAVYVYQCVNTYYNMNRNKYYPDRQKFFGTTNSSGVFTFPTTTGQYWDDWSTDGVVEATETCPTPFDRGTNGTIRADCPGWQSGEMLLLKIVGKNGQVEFQTLPLTSMNEAYLAGYTSSVTFTYRTSLSSNTSAPTEVAPKTTNAGNHKPVAKFQFATGTSGDGITWNWGSYSATYTSDQSITIPAGYGLNLKSVSTDADSGQTILCRWDSPTGPATANPFILDSRGYASGSDFTVCLYVIDGVCYSNLITINVHVQ